MKLTIHWNHFNCTLFLGLIAILHLLATDSGWTQEKTGGPVEANTQVIYPLIRTDRI